MFCHTAEPASVYRLQFQFQSIFEHWQRAMWMSSTIIYFIHKTQFYVKAFLQKALVQNLQTDLPVRRSDLSSADGSNTASGEGARLITKSTLFHVFSCSHKQHFHSAIYYRVVILSARLAE